jgi:membrane protein
MMYLYIRFMKRSNKAAVIFKPATNFLRLLWIALRRFIRDEAMNHSAALAYYTTFALPASLIILISLIGYFMGEKDIEQHLFAELERAMGQEGASQVKLMLDKVKNDSTHSAAWTGIIMLLFSSTVVFYTIQHSLNRLWRINDEIRHGFVKYVIDKFLSLVFILAFGILLLASLILQAFISWMNHYFGSVVRKTTQIVSEDPSFLDKALLYLGDIYNNYFSSGFFIVEFLVALALNTFLFACIFKFLPDAKVKWKIALPGGLLTALLFKAGQQFIGWKLGHTDFTNSYGPAGAVIIIFVWIFYSSTILFYGGIFVDLYGKQIGHPVKAIPGEHH